MVYGCGRDTSAIDAHHHKPSGFVLILWDREFLSVGERRLLGDEVSVAFRAYGRLRVGSTAASASHLVERRPPPTAKAPPISKRRSHEMTLVLLRFNFVYADFFFGGTYTFQDRDWDAIYDIRVRR
jgi:hypothetical protein